MLAVFISLLLWSAVAEVESPQRPSSSPAPEPTPPAAAYKANVAILCGEAMAGRAAGSDGGARAVEWIAAQFFARGLKPPAGLPACQEFDVPAPLPPTVLPSTSLQREVGSERVGLGLGSDFVPLPFSPDGDFGGELVFAGHGLVLGDRGIDDLGQLDLHGKVALVLRGGPNWRAEPAPLPLASLSFTQKIGAVAARGATGVLVVERAGDPGPGLGLAAVAQTVGAATVPCAWLDRAAAERILGADWLLAAQHALDAGRKAPPLPVAVQLRGAIRLERHAPLRTANVIAAVPGRERDEDDEWIVLAAHHDHIGRGEFGSLGEPDDVGRIHPGADDNASGVAALLELAPRFSAAPLLHRTLVIVAFGAEELGQRGSRWFLDHLPPGVRIAAMVDLNMIGRGERQVLSAFGAAGSPSLAASVRAASRQVGIEVQLRERSSYRSDQYAFAAHGIPAILFTTGLHDQYHRPADVPDLVEVDAALRIVDVIERVVRQLGEAPSTDEQKKRR